MNTLLTTIVLWLSTNFGLPANYDHPVVEFVPETKIVELRYKGLAGRQLQAGTRWRCQSARFGCAVSCWTGDLISQRFLPRSVPNRHLRDTLGSKGFFRTSVPNIASEIAGSPK